MLLGNFKVSVPCLCPQSFSSSECRTITSWRSEDCGLDPEFVTVTAPHFIHFQCAEWFKIGKQCHGYNRIFKLSGHLWTDPHYFTCHHETLWGLPPGSWRGEEVQLLLGPPSHWPVHAQLTTHNMTSLQGKIHTHMAHSCHAYMSNTNM